LPQVFQLGFTVMPLQMLLLNLLDQIPPDTQPDDGPRPESSSIARVPRHNGKTTWCSFAAARRSPPQPVEFGRTRDTAPAGWPTLP
jgi:hypothetical protein